VVHIICTFWKEDKERDVHIVPGLLENLTCPAFVYAHPNQLIHEAPIHEAQIRCFFRTELVPDPHLWSQIRISSPRPTLS
jgi:hypothetical protein